MGIPSYYRKLKDSVAGFVGSTGVQNPYGLYFDFNCLIYHVLNSTSIEQYPTEEAIVDDTLRIAWENALIKEVLNYVTKIVDIVAPTHEVLLSIDGVVPFAKMKQQRLRRFKSALSNSNGWDRNAITPGTHFMERLGTRLKTLRGKGLQWILQDASLPGEGEQKIMKYLRTKESTNTNNNYVIYGLDADLIVLSLIQQYKYPSQHIWLFRENIEYGELLRDASGNETYIYMDIQILQSYIEAQFTGHENAIVNYTMAMCFLGNDFLPHGLSQKMSDEGHAVMIEILKGCFAAGTPLLVGDQWNLTGLRSFVEQLAQTEQRDIERSLRKKLSHFPKITEDTHAEFYPAPKVEYDFFDGHNGSMKHTWRRIYYETYIGGAHRLAARAAAKHYVEGLHWIRSYYFGDSCSYAWHYPFFLPPLWVDLRIALDPPTLQGAALIATDQTIPTPLPQEQLAIVLPIESYWLIRDPVLKRLPYRAPQYWPLGYTLFSCGKKWMWECEAQIPLLTLDALRRIQDNA